MTSNKGAVFKLHQSFATALIEEAISVLRKVVAEMNLCLEFDVSILFVI